MERVNELNDIFGFSFNLAIVAIVPNIWDGRIFAIGPVCRYQLQVIVQLEILELECPVELRRPHFSSSI